MCVEWNCNYAKKFHTVKTGQRKFDDDFPWHGKLIFQIEQPFSTGVSVGVGKQARG